MLPELDDAAQQLVPATHTLGLIFILNCKAGAVPLSQPHAVRTFCDQCRRMLNDCDPAQVHLVPGQFVAVCTKFAAAAIAIKSTLSAVRPLQAAVYALQPSPSHFTPLHAELLKVCLLSKCYYAARPILKQELLHVDREATVVSPRDLLLYHYYAGMVETGLKSYKAAVQYFILCVSAPTHVLNTIMMEAYKKCLLCSLIETGEVPKLPKYTSPTITRPIKNQLAAYTEFSEAFAAGKPTELRTCLDKHAATFTADHNLGLAKQCVAALMRRLMRTLTETYITLSLPQMAEMVYLADAAAAEKQVRDMIVAGQINATIDGQKGTVRPTTASSRARTHTRHMCVRHLRVRPAPQHTRTSRSGPSLMMAWLTRWQVHFIDRYEQFDSKASLLGLESAMEQAVGMATKLHGVLASLSVDHNYLARAVTAEAQPQWEEEAMLSK